MANFDANEQCHFYPQPIMHRSITAAPSVLSDLLGRESAMRDWDFPGLDTELTDILDRPQWHNIQT